MPLTTKSPSLENEVLGEHACSAVEIPDILATAVSRVGKPNALRNDVAPVVYIRYLLEHSFSSTHPSEWSGSSLPTSMLSQRLSSVVRLPDHEYRDLPEAERTRLWNLAMERYNSVSSIHWREFAERHPNVSINPWINFGKPSVGREHIKVSRIVEYLSMYSEKKLLRDFPSLTPADVDSAILYAMDLLGD